MKELFTIKFTEIEDGGIKANADAEELNWEQIKIISEKLLPKVLAELIFEWVKKRYRPDVVRSIITNITYSLLTLENNEKENEHT